MSNTKQQKIEANAAAKRRVLEAHEDEFHQFLAEEMEARGFEYTPPLSEEEKAAQTIAELLQKYPSVAERVNARPQEHLDRAAEPDLDDQAEIPEGQSPWA